MPETKTQPKKNLDLEISELVIQMYTNMDTQIEFTADIVENKKVSGKYPFLCTNCKYSKDVLVQKSVNERFDIFFNRTKFYNFMLVSKLKKNQQLETRYDSDIVRENIIIMLNALFQISFPIKDQVVIKDDETVDLENMIRNLFRPNEFTYLKLNKLSTVTQVIWLNTIGSNPIYYQIYQKNKKYNEKVMDYVDQIDAKDIKDIMNNDNNDKIIELQRFFKTNIEKNPTFLEKRTKEEWILYFLVSNFKKNTKEYNDFIKNYIRKFINSEQQIYNQYNQYGNSSQQNEKQFYESIPGINFYQDYMSEIDELLPPKRVTVKKSGKSDKSGEEEDKNNIADALKNVKQTNDFTDFNRIYIENKSNSSQLMRLENGAYEIHLGLAVVGGKVDKTNLQFLCNYNSHRLGNDLNFLIKNTGEDSDKVRLSTYIDLENVKDTTEYIGVINSTIKKTIKKKGGSRKNRNRKSRSRKNRTID